MKFDIFGLVKRRLPALVGSFMIFCLTLQGAFGGLNGSAIAASYSPASLAREVQSNVQETVESVKDAAKNKLDEVTDQLEGNGYRAKNWAKQEARKTQAQLEDDQQAINHRARTNLTDAQNTAERKLNDTQNAAERTKNRIGETANRVGDRVSEAAESAADSIRNMAGK